MSKLQNSINTYPYGSAGLYNVKAYGAKGDGSTDDTAACQAAIDAAQAAGGGTVYFPVGTYKLVSVPLKLYSGSTPSIIPYSNITILGEGSNSLSGSIITQTSTGIDIIQGLNDVANGAQALNNIIKNIACVWGTATKTNSGNGIYLKQQSAGGPSFQQWTFENVTVEGCQGSGKYGFNFESLITSTLTDCQAQSCAGGFYLNGTGPGGGNFNSVNTSVTFNSCYANMAANATSGFRINDSTYISLIGCAVDIGANTSGSSYLVEGSSGVGFYGCGSELDGTSTLTNMWKIGADSGSNPSANVSIISCYGFQSKSTIDIYVTGTSTGVTIIGFEDNSSVSGSTGIKLDSGAQATAIDVNVAGAATPTNINAAAVFNQIITAGGTIFSNGSSIKVGGTAVRGTTEGTNQLVLFNGTAPAGTLTNGVTFYSASGEARVMDAAGNSSLLSPHDQETNEWVFDSVHTPSGKHLRIKMEQMMRKLNDMLGGGYIEEK